MNSDAIGTLGFMAYLVAGLLTTCWIAWMTPRSDKALDQIFRGTPILILAWWYFLPAAFYAFRRSTDKKVDESSPET